MRQLSRRTAIRVVAAGGGLLGLGVGGYLLRSVLVADRDSSPDAAGRGPDGAMMGSATAADMSAYQDLFDRHSELRRIVEIVPGGVRTITETDSPDLVARLRAHVGSMYTHLDQGSEVTCMSGSLPTLFASAGRYQRQFTLTARGVSVTETSNDPHVTAAIRAHAREITGFVNDGMPAMMSGMMGTQAPMG
jgi:hypothetical protein